MTNSMHDSFRELVFGYADLEPGERSRVDQHLSTCPDCRTLLSSLRFLGRELEECSHLPPELDFPFLRLSMTERQEERESLAALARRLRMRRLQPFTKQTKPNRTFDGAPHDSPWRRPTTRNPEER